jgi:hypothetical protein
LLDVTSAASSSPLASIRRWLSRLGMFLSACHFLSCCLLCTFVRLVFCHFLSCFYCAYWYV